MGRSPYGLGLGGGRGYPAGAWQALRRERSELAGAWRARWWAWLGSGGVARWRGRDRRAGGGPADSVVGVARPWGRGRGSGGGGASPAGRGGTARGGHGGQAGASAGDRSLRGTTSRRPAGTAPLGVSRAPPAPRGPPVLRFGGRARRRRTPLARQPGGGGEVPGGRSVNGGGATDRGPARSRLRGEAPPPVPPRGPCACAVRPLLPGPGDLSARAPARPRQRGRSGDLGPCRLSL